MNAFDLDDTAVSHSFTSSTGTPAGAVAFPLLAQPDETADGRMETGRLEAFSDGVIAIIITIMVLEMKAPHAADFAALGPIVPVLSSYILSFIYVGIYWNNHHHLLQATRGVTASIMWANLHLLFWLSLIPFVTGWMGQTNFAALPVALYGVVLLLSGIAFLILQRRIVSNQGRESALAKALGSDFKGRLSPALYAVAIPASFFATWAAGAIYIAVALMWLVPDRRFENALGLERADHA